MTSKYWTTNHKSSVNKATFEQKEAIVEADNTSCGESIEEDIVTIKTSNMESRNNEANVQEPSKNFTISSSLASIKRRPDSLKLSYDYGSNSTDLVKSATSTAVDVNQSKSLSAASSKSKKSTSYDLWVNENVDVKDRNGSSAMGEKKLDLPGRVSFR